MAFTVPNFVDEDVNAHYNTIIIIVMIWKTHSTIGFSANYKNSESKGTLPAYNNYYDINNY